VPHGILTGRVLDEDGQPFAGAAMTVLRYRFDPAGRRRMLQTADRAFTDDLGRFRAWGLAPGRYYVKADYTRDRYSTATSGPQAPDAPGEGYKPTYYPGVDDSQQAAAVEVASGLETAGIEFKLILSRMFRVRGRVLDTAGNERPRNVGVTLLPRDLGWRAFGEAHHTTVAADGSFDIGGVSPGAYRLEAHQYPEELHASESIDIADRNATGLVLRLAPGFELSGLATVEGRSDFHFSQYASVSLEAAGENRGGSSATINEDGTFTIGNVAPGRYRMRAWAEPRAEVYLKSARFGPDDVLDGELDLRHAPDPAARLELVFSPRPASLKGAVIDDDNKPVPGAVVVLLPDSAQRDQFERYGLATADQDGRYTITTRPGEYQAVALEGFEFGEWLDPAVAEKAEKNAVAVTLGEGSREVRNLKVTRPENR
jgi:protocatechuate 3,4-dioxygenase beta subunit